MSNKELKSNCDRCGGLVNSTTTSSCSIGSIEITDYISMDNKRKNILCSFDDRFFCEECMDGYICVDCSKELSLEEKEVLKAAGKI